MSAYAHQRENTPPPPPSCFQLLDAVVIVVVVVDVADDLQQYQTWLRAKAQLNNCPHIRRLREMLRESN
jgi:hypothetical protein